MMELFATHFMQLDQALKTLVLVALSSSKVYLATVPIFNESVLHLPTKRKLVLHNNKPWSELSSMDSLTFNQTVNKRVRGLGPISASNHVRNDLGLILNLIFVTSLSRIKLGEGGKWQKIQRESRTCWGCWSSRQTSEISDSELRNLTNLRTTFNEP